MQTQYAFYQSELQKLILAEVERRKENLTGAHRATGFDFAEYKHQVGIIEGFRMALQLCEEAEAMTKNR
jgi:hypothetical protein